ncbi:MAG: NAD(P)/FAD-dependent oxidoreductase [Chloroflexi bacterium]|nr:MAG: NAD(P)/FAD-dependent oxidoreductase [Chloroflexota bacterium]
MSEWDIVVAGAGHNSLLTAAYAARAGFKVLVLEGADRIGGDTTSEELTLRGFIHDPCATAHNLIQSNPLMRDNELQLDRYGLRYLYPDPVFTMPFRDGRSITMWRDLDRTCAELARFSEADAKAYRTLLNDWQSLSPIINDEREHPPRPPAQVMARTRAGALGDRGVSIRHASALEVITPPAARAGADHRRERWHHSDLEAGHQDRGRERARDRRRHRGRVEVRRDKGGRVLDPHPPSAGYRGRGEPRAGLRRGHRPLEAERHDVRGALRVERAAPIQDGSRLDGERHHGRPRIARLAGAHAGGLPRRPARPR